MSTLAVSAMLTSLPCDFGEAVRQSAALGFRHVDVVALAERPPEHADVLADTGVLVSCAPIGRGLPEGCMLDAADIEQRRSAVRRMQRHIDDAALLGATHCYLIPGLETSPGALAHFGDACGVLADHAARRMVRLCVEHIPGRALPSALGMLDWLERLGHANLFLLLDVGHCLLTGEEAAAVVARAGSRLGYVHFDDNDGVGDLHWPLLTGRLTEEALRRALAALTAAGYRGVVALELNPQNADPVAALRDGKALLEQEAPPAAG